MKPLYSLMASCNPLMHVLYVLNPLRIASHASTLMFGPGQRVTLPPYPPPFPSAILIIDDHQFDNGIDIYLCIIFLQCTVQQLEPFRMTYRICERSFAQLCNRAHNARHSILLLVRVVRTVGSRINHSQILRWVIQEPFTGRRVDTDVLSRILWVCRQESHVLHSPFGGTGGCASEGEDNGSIPNHAGRAGNVHFNSIVDVLQIQPIAFCMRVGYGFAFVGKADVISFDILEVVAGDDMSSVQIYFVPQAFAVPHLMYSWDPTMRNKNLCC